MKLWDQEMADELIPEKMQGALKRYLEDKIPPGGFLTAVLENNLKEACLRADPENRKIIVDYVTYLYNYAPRVCWGSPENVEGWLAKRTAEKSGVIYE